MPMTSSIRLDLLPSSARDFFRGLPVLITGGLGFIGSNLAHWLLALGARVTIADSLAPQYGGNPFNIHDIVSDVEVHHVDQRDDAALRNLVPRFHHVFNLVGQVSHVDSMEDPYTDLRTNVLSHVSLLEAFRRFNPNVKILFAGTRGQYGRPGHHLVDENTPIAPIDVNGVNKHAGEMYHFLYGRTHGFNVCSLRLTNTYGPRHTMRTARQGFFAWFIRQALDGDEIRLFGAGKALRDFNHVDDVVRALLMAMASKEANGQIFNLGGGAPVTVAQVAHWIVESAGTGSIKEIPYPNEIQPIEIGDYHADFSKINRVLGWSPRVPLREGLAATVAYYREHRDHYWKRVIYP